MKLDFSGAGPVLRKAWERLGPLPGGSWLFGKLLGLINPYTGSVGPRVLELGPGHARIAIRDRRGVRNHVASVHAIAMANLAEMSTGLALMCGVPEDARVIIQRLSVEYLRKARGQLTAECNCQPPATSERRELELESTITDQAGEVVARGRAVWVIGPKRRS